MFSWMIGRSFNILDNYKMFLTVDLIIISILIYKFYLQYSVSLVTDCNEIFSCNKNLQNFLKNIKEDIRLNLK